jgi:FAD/FMN-containing dehydrogenase
LDSPYYFPFPKPRRHERVSRRRVAPRRTDDINQLALPPAPSAPGLLILKPGHPKFEAHMACYNKRTLKRPLLRGVCSSLEAVQAMVSWVRQHSLPFAVRSGGHSFEGFSNSTSVVIDVRGLNSVTFNTATREVTVGAGAALRDIYTTLSTRGAAFVGGTCPFVGIGGHVLGGGYGLLSRAYGFACDNLKSLTLVDAQSQVLDVSATSRPDLFWAAKGGGGGAFGVATEFVFQTHPITHVINFRIAWQLSRSKALRVIKAWQQWAPNAPKDITSLLNVGKLSSGEFNIRCVGQSIGEESDVESVIQSLTAVQPATTSTITPRTFFAAVKAFAGNWNTPETNFYKERSDLTPALSDAAILTLLDELSQIPSGYVIALINAYGGAINDVANSATAFPHRAGTELGIHYYSQWSNLSDTSQRMAKMEKVFNAMRPHVPGAAYVNYSDTQLQDFEQSYWGPNLPRLKAIKRQADPNNMFFHPQSVRPA